MTRPVLIAFLAFLPALAWGQEISPERFVPFAPGDRWEYERKGVSRSEADNGGKPTRYTSYEVIEVDRDTTIAGEQWHVYRFGRYAADRSLVDETACVGRYVRAPRGDRELTELQVHDRSESQCNFELGGYVFAQRETETTVDIGNASYPAEATEEWVFFNSGVGGSSSERTSLHAVDIGRVRYRYARARRLSPTSSDTTTGRLLYAEVGGATYGTHAVSRTVSRSARPAFSVAAFPNPGAGPLRVRVEGAARGRLSIEALDVLGRSVWSGVEAVSTGSFDLPASAWPSGVYVVRIRDAEEVTATVRVTRL